MHLVTIFEQIYIPFVILNYLEKWLVGVCLFSAKDLIPYSFRIKRVFFIVFLVLTKPCLFYQLYFIFSDTLYTD